MTGAIAEHEKGSAALNSVLAALLLTSLNILVGWFSGSLGILAEAAHSGLDLIAALVTYIAVRISARPPDEDHPYGHGKVENLSAMAEMVLLLCTCVWIIHEAVDRLGSKQIEVQASMWTFLVMAVTIGVDISRSRMLFAAAKKHRSQALEADALHFSTDIWSAAVVIIGLCGVKLASWFPAASFLAKADAVAALVVALIVIFISGRLGLRTFQALLDTAPPGTSEKIRTDVEAMEQVLDCHSVRLRQSGPHYFVDLHITLDGNQTLQSAHAITELVEQVVQKTLPDADVTVHPEPRKAPEQPKS